MSYRSCIMNGMARTRSLIDTNRCAPRERRLPPGGFGAVYAVAHNVSMDIQD